MSTAVLPYLPDASDLALPKHRWAQIYYSQAIEKIVAHIRALARGGRAEIVNAGGEDEFPTGFALFKWWPAAIPHPLRAVRNAWLYRMAHANTPFVVANAMWKFRESMAATLSAFDTAAQLSWAAEQPDRVHDDIDIYDLDIVAVDHVAARIRLCENFAFLERITSDSLMALQQPSAAAAAAMESISSAI